MNRPFWIAILLIIVSGCSTQNYVHKQHTAGLMAPERHYVLKPFEICDFKVQISDPHVLNVVRTQMQSALQQQFKKYLNADGRIDVVDAANCETQLFMDVINMTDTLWDYEASKFSVDLDTAIIFTTEITLTLSGRQEIFRLHEESSIPKGVYNVFNHSNTFTTNSVRNRTNFADKMIVKLLEKGGTI